MRDYPCPHCGGRGEVILDNDFEGWPIWRRCGYCEGRGHFTRPVLPRGSVRAFAVTDICPPERGSIGTLLRFPEPDPTQIVYATKASQAKMVAARNLYSDLLPRSMSDILQSLRVRRAPEHDGEAGR